MKISPLFLNTICSLIKSAPVTFFCNTNYAQSSLAPVAKKSVPQTLLHLHTGSAEEDFTTKLFGEVRVSIFCSATDVIWLVPDTGEAQQPRDGEAASSLCQATLYISTVVGNFSFNNNCTLTALTLVHRNDLGHLHILSSMYKHLLEPKSYPNHDRPLRQRRQARGEETENKRQKSPN